MTVWSAAALAETLCASDAVTTRRPEREVMLLANRAIKVFMMELFADGVRKRHPQGFSKILDLVMISQASFGASLVQTAHARSLPFLSIVPRDEEHSILPFPDDSHVLVHPTLSFPYLTCSEHSSFAPAPSPMSSCLNV